MSQIVFSKSVGLPASPSSGKVKLLIDDSTTPRLYTLDSGGVARPVNKLANGCTGTVSGGYATETYLAGSAIVVPSTAWRAKYEYACTWDMTKTAAGIATPIVRLKVGTAGTTSDTTRITFTFGAGTATADTGIFTLRAVFYTAGASATMAGYCKVDHLLASTGITNTGAAGTGIIIASSASFDVTSSTTIGLSFNGGTSFSGSCSLVQSELLVGTE